MLNTRSAFAGITWNLQLITARCLRFLTHFSSGRRRRLLKRLQRSHLILDERSNRRKCLSSHLGANMNGRNRFGAVIGGHVFKNMEERRGRRNATDALLSYQDVSVASPGRTPEEHSPKTRFFKGGPVNESNLGKPFVGIDFDHLDPGSPGEDRSMGAYRLRRSKDAASDEILGASVV